MRLLSNIKKQRGISLLEVLLSLSIIAIILIMATRYFFLASDNDRVNSTRQEIGELIAAIQGWKSQNPTYDPNTLTLDNLYNEGFLTLSHNLKIISGAVTLYDPWGDTFTLTGNTTYATITIPLQKKKYCVALQNTYPYGTCSSDNLFTLTYPEQTSV